MKYASKLDIKYRKLLSSIIPSPTFNIIAPKICIEIEKNIPDDGTVLIAGCGEGGEGLSGFSDEFVKNSIVALDVRDTNFTDVVGDIHNMPFDNESFDAVICQATLEHVRNEREAVREMERVLKKGGYMYVDVPFIQGYHALPTDFRRFTSIGLDKIINNSGKFEIISTGASKGPTSSIIWVMCEYLSFLFSIGNYKTRRVISGILRVVFFWVKYIDIILAKTHGFGSDSLSIPSAVYWYGKKVDND